MVSTYSKRGILRYAYQTQGSIGILGRLEQFAAGVGVDILKGAVRITATAEGLSTSYALISTGGSAGQGQISSRDSFFEVCQELIDRWNGCAKYLRATTGADPLEADIYAILMALNQNDTDYVQDYSLVAVKGYTTNWNAILK